MSRRYVWPISKTCSLQCPGCQFTGFLRDSKPRADEDLRQRQYTEILVPCHQLGPFSLPSSLPQRRVVQMRASVFSVLSACWRSWLCGHSLAFLIWNTEPLWRFRFLSRLVSWFQGAEVILGMEEAEMESAERLAILPSDFQVLWALPFSQLNHSRLCRIRDQLAPFVSGLSRALRGWDFHEPRCPAEVSREPEFEVLGQAGRSVERVSVSVILPVYNDADALQRSLRRWSQQQEGDFEILVVDDGSDDGAWEQCRSILQEGSAPFRWIHLPRSFRRERGDFSFRAGVARNLGAMLARGEILLFVDSDILVPKNTVSQVRRSSAPQTFLQAKRWQLQAEVEEGLSHEQLMERGRVLQNGYWENFQKNPQAWNEQPHKWRYVSSFFLSCRRDSFFSLGAFRKNYIHYGCEDTDLGVRAARSGYRLELLDLDVLHISPRIERSEFQLDPERRERLLVSAFVQLYRNTLDPEVFAELIDTHQDRDIIK